MMANHRQQRTPTSSLSPQEQLLAPLEKIWNMGMLRLKFQLCQPADPMDFLCRQISISRSEIKAEKLTLLELWLNTKEQEWKHE